MNDPVRFHPPVKPFLYASGLVLAVSGFFLAGSADHGPRPVLAAGGATNYLSLPMPDFGFSPELFFGSRPRTYFPESRLSTIWETLRVETDLVEGTNLQLRIDRPLPGGNLAVDLFNLTPERWRDFVKAEEERNKIERAKDMDQNVRRIVDLDLLDGEANLLIYGSQSLGVSYNVPFYLKATKNHSPSPIFNFDQSIDLSIKGRIGKKVKVNVDTSQKSLKQIQVDYTATKKEAFIQNISAGNISVSLPGTALAAGSAGGGSEAFGIKVDAKKGKFNFQMIASMARGVTAEKTFEGNTLVGGADIADYNYERFKYFVIPEPYRPGTLKIYLDDHVQQLNSEITFANGLHCTRLTPGQDYEEQSDGLIFFKRGLNSSFDLLMTYEPVLGTIPTPAGTNNSYNIVVSNVTPASGRQAFIYLLHQGDLSPYEFRGVYNLRQQNIIRDSFQVWVVNKAQQSSGANLSATTDVRLVQDADRSFIANYPVSGKELKYVLDEARGMLVLHSQDPFRVFYDRRLVDPDQVIYTYSYYNSANQALSLYNIHIEWNAEVKSYQLQYDLIENSEVITVDGRVVKKGDDYDIDYLSGTVKFRKPVNPKARIQMVYQYNPFGTFSQQLLLGLRTDYKPADWVSFTGLGFYSGRQRPVKVPTVATVADEHIVGAVLGTAAFSGEQFTTGFSNLGVKLSKTFPFDVSFSAEAAGSIYNPNNFGQAMIDDFEGNQFATSVGLKYRDFMLYTPVNSQEWQNGIDATNRGKLFYRDYRNWNGITGPTYYQFGEHVFGEDKVGLQSTYQNDSDRTNIAYSEKPGPYMVGMGHLDEDQLSADEFDRQQSMVLDYDFNNSRTNAGWASVIWNNSLGSPGRDFTSYVECDIWARLIGANSSDEVQLEIGLGQFSEDIDDDGSASIQGEQTTADDGFVFRDPLGSGNTRIGGGDHKLRLRANGVTYLSETGDEVLQTEDMDRDRRLARLTTTTNLFLPNATFAHVLASGSPVLDSANLYVRSDGKWHLLRIAIDMNAMTSDEKEFLKKRIKNVVLIVQEKNGKRGKLLLEEMKFVGSAYNDLRLNAQTGSTDVNQHLNISFVDMANNSYRSNNLRDFTENDKDFADAPVFSGEPSYDDMHGFVLNSEWPTMKEQSLQLDYFNLENHDFTQPIPNQTNTMVLVGRPFGSGAAADARYYSQLKIWTRVVSTAGSEWFFYRFGSSSQDYWEYRIPVSDLTAHKWSLIKIDLATAAKSTNWLYASPAGKDDAYRMEGRPALRSITYVAYGIYASGLSQVTNSGRIWIDDTFFDKPRIQTGFAYAFSGSLSLRKHLKLGYSYSKVDKVFSRVGGAGSGTETSSRTYDASWSSLAWLPVTVSWNRSEQLSDPEDITVPFYEKGRYVNNVWNVSSGLKLTAWKDVFGDASRFMPDFTGTYRVASSSNSQPLNFSKDYSLLQRSKSEALSLSASWTAPTPTNWKASLKPSADFAYSRDQQMSYAYLVGNSITNIITIPDSTVESFNLRLPFVWKTLNISPTYSYQVSFAGTRAQSFTALDPILRAWAPGIVSNLISGRTRNISLPITLGKIWILTPSFNYSVGYQEAGFFSSPAIGSNGLIRHPSYSLSVGGGYGSFNFKKFPLQSLAPDYKRTLSVANQFIRNDDHGGMDYFWKTTGAFGLAYAPFPYQFFAIPFLGYFPSLDLVSRYTNYPNATITLSESFGLRLGIDILKVVTGTISYSLNQNTSRSRNGWNYAFKVDHSLQYGSSFDLTKKVGKEAEKDAKESEPRPGKRRSAKVETEKGKKPYKKSASLSYGLRYTYSFDYINAVKRWTLGPNLQLNYQWTAEASGSLSVDYSFGRDNIFSPSDPFLAYVKAHLPGLDGYVKKPGDNGPAENPTIDPRDTSTFGFQVTFRFPSNLPDTWKVPIIKKTVKLDTRINHSTTFEFRNNLAHSQDDAFRNVDTVAHFGLTHAITYDISANVDGDIYLKFSYDETETWFEKRLWPDTQEVLGSVELGLKLRIKF